MKKEITLLLSLITLFSLSACGANTPQNAPTPTPTDASIDEGTPTETATVLVAYFSATNTTEGVAQTIAELLDADIYEIVPEVPYTSEDLDWNDSSSRTTTEMNDPDTRPAISGAAGNMEDYDIVFLGYPIWWGEAPKIISTFLESCEFDGKTIVPFCTSGGSGIGSSATNLHKLAQGATWLDGQRFAGNASQSTVESWVNGLNLTFTK